MGVGTTKEMQAVRVSGGTGPIYTLGRAEAEAWGTSNLLRMEPVLLRAGIRLRPRDHRRANVQELNEVL